MVDRITAGMVAMFVVIIWAVIASNANYAMGEPLDINANPDGTIDVSCVSCTVPGHLFFAPIYGGIGVVNVVNAVEERILTSIRSAALRDDPGTGFVPDNETVIDATYVDGASKKACLQTAWKSGALELTESGSYRLYAKPVNDTFGNPVDKCWMVVTRP